MFIYADETGNSGKKVDDAQEWYRLGAIMSVADVELNLSATMTPIVTKLQKNRLHAKDMLPSQVADAANAICDALDAAGPWTFWTFGIHKPFLPTTKFVDTVFDSGENLAVPPMWYNLELFRHAICQAVDDCMREKTRAEFWEAYLKDDIVGIQACVRTIWNYVPRKVTDSRIREVMREAFDFVLKHPEQFTLLAAEKREGYHGHTPNMIAFTSIFGAIHEFATEHNSPPIAFVHDQQQEFKNSMRKAYDTYGRMTSKEDMMGIIPRMGIAKYDLAEFTISSSSTSFGLQATDLLLWVVQRTKPTPDLLAVRKRMEPNVKEAEISRRMSDLIVKMRAIQSQRADVSEAQIANGREFLAIETMVRQGRVRALVDAKR
jgi:hypothetical protein